MSNKIKVAYRITHIQNIPNILQYGIVSSDSPCRNPNFIPIGDPNVIKAREESLKCKKIPRGSIPFYFGPRSPMLYVIQNGHNGVTKYSGQEIVYIVIDLYKIIKNKIDCIFTDGHPLNEETGFYQKEDLTNIDNIINFSDIYAHFWMNTAEDPDKKRRKEAELLILQDLPLDYVLGFVVFNTTAQEILLSYGIETKQIVVRRDYYY